MAKLGSVKFSQDLKWIPKDDDVQVPGSDTYAHSGIVVVKGAQSQSEFRTYQFGEITFSDWRALKKMAEDRSAEIFIPKKGGPTYKVIFAQQNPIKIYGRDDDVEIVNGGEIRLIMLSEEG